MVRIHACHAWGREFESRPDRQTTKKELSQRELSTYHLINLSTVAKPGLLGFDSKDNGFVSMQADAPEAFDHRRKTIIGENNYALAA